MCDSVSIDIDGDRGSIEGICGSQFQPVVDEFVANFGSRGEVGMSVAVTQEGKTVEDFWGGCNEFAMTACYKG